MPLGGVVLVRLGSGYLSSHSFIHTHSLGYLRQEAKGVESKFILFLSLLVFYSRVVCSVYVLCACLSRVCVVGIKSVVARGCSER